jgi:hypothetical protein
MSSSKPIDFKTLEITRVSVSKPKDVSKDGVTLGKRVYLQYNHPTEGLVPLVIKTPKMKYNFGLSAWDSENGPKKYVLNSYFTAQNKEFLDFCVALEEHLKTAIVDNSTNWFNMKKPFTRDLVEQMETLYPIVKRKFNKETGEEYPPSIKFNFPMWPNKTTGKPEFTTSVYLSKNQRVALTPDNTEEAIPNGSEGEAVVFCSLFVSTSNRKVSLSMNANMVKVYPKLTKTMDFPFSDDEDDEVEAGGSDDGNSSVVSSVAPVVASLPTKKTPTRKATPAPVLVQESELSETED